MMGIFSYFIYQSTHVFFPLNFVRNTAYSSNHNPVFVVRSFGQLIAIEEDLLRAFVEKETGVKNPKIPLKLKHTKEKFYRLAKDGEQATIEVGMALGQNLNAQLLGTSQKTL